MSLNVLPPKTSINPNPTPQPISAEQLTQLREGLGLDQVNDTPDTDKPVSTVQAAAITAAVNTAVSTAVNTAQAAPPPLAAATADIALDAGFRQYEPLTVTGATNIAVSGDVKGASAAMVVVANGANVPTVSGAVAWSDDMGFLNTAGIDNEFYVRHNGKQRVYAWSQAAVVSATPAPPAPAPPAPSPAPAPADVTAPTFVGAAVANATPTKVTITYSEALSPTLTGSITVGGVVRDVVSQTVVGSSVEVIVSAAYANGETITVTVPEGCVKDVAGNPAAALAAQAVTNNIAASGGSADAEVSEWMTRVSAAGGVLSGADQTAAEAFVSSAKSSGYWPKFRRLNLCLGNFAASLVPLVNTVGSATDVASGLVAADYTEATGWSTNGTNKYLDTNYIPTEDTGGLSVYLRTTQASDAAGRVAMGGSSASDTFRIAGNRNASGSSAAGAVTGTWGGTANGASATGGFVAGHWHAVRRGAADIELFKNGASVATNTANTTMGDAAFSVVLFGLKTTGPAVTAFLASGSSISGYGIDSGMTATEAAAFNTHMQSLQTAMGRNV